LTQHEISNTVKETTHRKEKKRDKRGNGKEKEEEKEERRGSHQEVVDRREEREDEGRERRFAFVDFRVRKGKAGTRLKKFCATLKFHHRNKGS